MLGPWPGPAGHFSARLRRPRCPRRRARTMARPRRPAARWQRAAPRRCIVARSRRMTCRATRTGGSPSSAPRMRSRATRGRPACCPASRCTCTSRRRRASSGPPPSASAGTAATWPAGSGGPRRCAGTGRRRAGSPARPGPCTPPGAATLTVPTDDWPAGAYLIRLDADNGAQRYVPLTVRSASTAGKVVLKQAVPTWQAYNTWGSYDLYLGPGGYADRSLRRSAWTGPVTSTARTCSWCTSASWSTSPSGSGLPLAYLTSMDIASDPTLAGRRQRADLARPRRVLEPAGARASSPRPATGA